jgi:hypothetical protein
VYLYPEKIHNEKAMSEGKSTRKNAKQYDFMIPAMKKADSRITETGLIYEDGGENGIRTHDGV